MTEKNTPFLEFSNLCEKLQATSKKLQKRSILAKFLPLLSDEELRVVALFILGKIFPDYDSRSINVSWRTLQKIYEKIKVARRNSNFLSILDVKNVFVEIAQTTGKGSRKKINQLLEDLFYRANEIERKYLTKIIFGEMRIGLAEGLLLESIAEAANVKLKDVRRAQMYLGDPGEVASIALKHGAKELREINVKLFRPLQPMLAELAEDFSKVFKEHDGQTSLEFKFDGARVQIHKEKNKIKIYTRHLSDVTVSLPDIVEVIKQKFNAYSAIVEGEVVAVGKDNRPLPFQELMRRFRRVHDIEITQNEVPIRLYLFDLLYLNKKSYVEAPYSARVALLEKNCEKGILVKRLVTAKETEAVTFLQNALDQGHEGLMAKKLHSEYLPGARGKRWFKIKPSETLDLVVIAADWGSGRRVGWL